MWVRVTRVAVLVLWAEHVSGGLHKGELCKYLALISPLFFSAIFLDCIPRKIPAICFKDTDLQKKLKIGRDIMSTKSYFVKVFFCDTKNCRMDKACAHSDISFCQKFWRVAHPSIYYITLRLLSFVDDD